MPSREERQIYVDLVGFEGLRVKATQTTQKVQQGYSMPALTNLTLESKLVDKTKQMAEYTRTELIELPTRLLPVAPEISDLGFVVYVPQDVIRTTAPPTIGAAYSAWTCTGKPDMGATLNAYIHTYPAEGPPGWLAFWFAKVRATSDPAVKTWYSQEDYHWPRILEQLKFYVTSPGFDYPTWDASISSVVVGSTPAVSLTPTDMTVQAKLVESYSGKTTLKYELFYSTTEWSQAYLDADGTQKPQPGVIEWDLPGSRHQRLDDILHGLVYVPRAYFDAEDGKYQTDDPGDPPVAGFTSVSSIPPKRFVATNQTTWVTHTAHNEVKSRNGMYERLKITAYAPTVPTVWN